MTLEINLLSRVKIVAVKDIEGIITARIDYADGTTRWDMTYWVNGERRTISCEPRELEVLP